MTDTPVTADTLRALAADTLRLAADATPAPWQVNPRNDLEVEVVIPCDYSDTGWYYVATTHTGDESRTDAAFIAHTRAAAPTLATAVLALLEVAEAAELTVRHFARNQTSGNFQGDDEHEAWTALTRALAALAEAR
jgi:hypothetical protein